jgi:hypothetical protein
MRHINASQPTYITLHDGMTDEPVIIPAQPGTAMINLRKFRCMYDLIGEAYNLTQSPSSYWYRLFPEDPQFPRSPIIENDVLTRFNGIRNIIEGRIANYWQSDSMKGNWERSLYVKKILASAGF